MSLGEALPAGWELWNEERHRIVLVYRPDVFDSQAFPAPCLPTVYLTKGRRNRRPGNPEPHPEDSWYLTLSLEPDVARERESFDDREAAIDGTLELTRRFADGDVDYRTLYQVPREAYLERLDELTGRIE